MEGERETLACSSHCGRPTANVRPPPPAFTFMAWSGPAGRRLCSMCAHKPWCSLPLSLVSILMGEKKFLSTWLVAFLSFWEIPDVPGPVPGTLLAEKMTQGVPC